MLRRLSVLADVAALVLVGGLTAAVLTLVGRPILESDVLLFFLFIPLWPVIGLGMRAYHPHSVGRGLSITVADEFVTIFGVATIWSWFLLVARAGVVPGGITQLLPSLTIWALAVVTVLVSRSLLRRYARHRGWYQQRVLVIGRSFDASKVTSRVDRHPEWGLTVAAEVDVAEPSFADEDGATVDGPALVANCAELNVSRVIFATPPGELNARTDLTRVFIESGIQVDFVPGEAEILRSGAEVSDIEGLPLVSMPGARPPRSWGLLKRVFDLMVAVPALLLVGPLLLYAMLRIKLDSPGPAFYRQTRAGLDGRPFELLKLRTMIDNADDLRDELAGLAMHGGGLENGVFKVAADPRVTKAGGRLRSRSIDELPQLWNVIKGEMSLVGPRPLPLSEDQRVAGHYELRRHVRPGMTGPWQVNGRSDIPFHDMLRLDYSYVLNWSFARDVKLLTQTIDAVFRGRGAY
jgi:exopolysaccharide biosynthesis polyprenyl glycosylphosphotransferase